MSYAQIAARLGITRQRVGQIIKAALEDAAERRADLAELLWVRELELIRVQMREAAEIIRTRCDACDDEEQRRRSCELCGSTGYRYPVDKRMAALDREMSCQDRRIKLLQLERRPYLALVEAEKKREFYEPLMQIPIDQLTAELELLLSLEEDADGEE